MRYDSIVVHGLNPEPWRVGPVSMKRGQGGKMIPVVAPDPALAAFQETYRDELRRQEVPLLKPPYQIRFFWWRELVVYQGKVRQVTKQRVDQTNLQKAGEDALQPQKKTQYREHFDGVIENDRFCQYSSGLIVAQEKGVYPIVALEICSEIMTTGKVQLPLDMMDETAEAVVRAMELNANSDSVDEGLI